MTGKPTQSTAHAADPSSRPISGVLDQETGLDWDGLPLHLGRLELLKAGMMACLGVLCRLPSQQQQVRCMPRAGQLRAADTQRQQMHWAALPCTALGSCTKAMPGVQRTSQASLSAMASR
jgi:hypothetical protein